VYIDFDRLPESSNSESINLLLHLCQKKKKKRKRKQQKWLSHKIFQFFTWDNASCVAPSYS
jgi:hypothetical protein